MQEDKQIEHYFIHRDPSKEKMLWKPEYHFTAPSGWINDPNGLIFYKGWYHLFYQFNPYGCDWGSMHWGHAVSKDLFQWKDLPIALKPDQSYDDHPAGGCFSGSCVEHEGKLFAFYSSTTLDGEQVMQSQSLAISEDGIHFTKYQGNPVIKSPPKGACEDFRDPKVFKKNGRWYMVVGGSVGGAKKPGGDGKVFLYQSEDLYHWEYIGNLIESLGRFGSMFECPDLFELDGKWVLTCSPINHPSYNKAMYFVGEVDLDTASFYIEKTGNIDHGSDYYAPQSFLDENGNRMMIAWANQWEWMPWFAGWGPTSVEGWRGAMNLPRRACLDEDLTLRAEPPETIRKLEKNINRWTDLRIDTHRKEILSESSRRFRLSLEAEPKKVESRFIEIGLLDDGRRSVRLRLDLAGGFVSLDREEADGFTGGIMTASIEVTGEKINLEIFVDRSMVEVFVNGGRQCISANIYPNENQNKTWIRTPYREAELSLLEVADIESVWNENTISECIYTA